jgi:hypothetical protein
MASLEEKQKYYQYGASGWSYKQPPTLDRSLHEELTRIGGCDRFNDPIYRFNWGGVAVVRTSEDDDSPIVRGDIAGTKVSRGRLQTRYFFGRVLEPLALCYHNRKGKVVRVKRLSQVPKNRVTFREDEIVDYGQLYWYLERKLTPEQLVEALIYTRDDPSIPSRGDYVCLLKIATPEGLYFEPDGAYLEAIREHFFEFRNESLSDLKLKDREARNAARTERESEEAARQKRIVETLMAHQMKQSPDQLFMR